jgi:hypothetical protein
MSSIYPACTVPLDKIRMVDDIEGCEGGGHIMTDGCGYISSSLLLRLPVGIHSGKGREERREEHLFPSVLQVRVSCGLGLFKGCLVVTSDPALCPSGICYLSLSLFLSFFFSLYLSLYLSLFLSLSLSLSLISSPTRWYRFPQEHAESSRFERGPAPARLELLARSQLQL